MLDSSWLDVRFSEADVTLRDGGPGESHFTGSGRVTYGDLISFDVDLFAQQVTVQSRMDCLGSRRRIVEVAVHVLGEDDDGVDVRFTGTPKAAYGQFDAAARRFFFRKGNASRSFDEHLFKRIPR